MTTTSLAERLATDGLQQHLFTAPTTVAAACGLFGVACWGSSECCGESCGWTFICE
ncbi:hypothetical protein [Streptomyces flavidovirens]|uniref:hypothetical protein n=1 Tax=Streptomyces flavidovirens TaxID=67298 RepID=UPI00042367E1|nr:hypothetical protein [Streptomyces flavidovirens]